ncbi:CtsR family transcriptional regulator [Clostridiaceae bacterium 35-E11]
MARLSDIIEIFIKELLKDANNRAVEIQRNELASYFDCAPSQINYVLTTRFTLDKGYLVESRRGGGGHIKIAQMNIDKNQYVKILLEQIGNAISKMKGVSIINMLKERGFITERERLLMTVAISDRSINTPINIKDEVRANLLKRMVIVLLEHHGGE